MVHFIMQKKATGRAADLEREILCQRKNKNRL